MGTRMTDKHILFIFALNVWQCLIADAYRTFETDGVTTILSLENETVNIECVADVQMAYCGFIHPLGWRYSFSGADLINGYCSKKVNVTKADSGEWQCHIGKKFVGVEIKRRILVRVVDKVAAVRAAIRAVHGTEATLACATIQAFTPIGYCRFEPPNGSPFSIDSAINKSNAILGKYYFPGNRSLDRGDCAVTIRKVKYEDEGEWTCGAGLEDGKEYTDVISLEVRGLYTMSASVTGLAFGVVGIAAFLLLLGYAAWRRRHMLGSRRRPPERIEIEDLGPRPPGTSEPTPTGSPRPDRPIPTVVVESPSPTTSPQAP